VLGAEAGYSMPRAAVASAVASAVPAAGAADDADDAPKDLQRRERAVGGAGWAPRQWTTGQAAHAEDIVQGCFVQTRVRCPLF
jgi:hypothetical protein